ncbi:LON peptidase N-terminal domain and RING finger protein 1 [Lasiodiplodia hormozganensis]|uniref:LON peptidase N-terminal domain and RING finger protein 1 n=1 Tax=Lasiodiplodia hormozganensis TaxID=869390 RepID=A0AA39Z454_9PEZI|nr:LON peptidase N-terminal domain and RING finger protein 1 [Lasiodiplodia hormozganensis]
MSLLRAAGPSFTGSGEKSLDLELAHPDLMRSHDTHPADGKSAVALAAHEDARQIVRLVQCPQCSRPFRTPVTLPCGHALCRHCLPESFHRQNISYPATPDRRLGIICPILDCGREHPVGECNVDVTLSKIMELVAHVMDESKPAADDSPTMLEVIQNHTADTPMDGLEKEGPVQRTTITLHGGRLLATYTLADMGQLDITSEVSYISLAEDGSDFSELDVAVLDRLKEATHKELDCHVCYNLLLEPVTTSCGHTFCRKCLVRALDHTVHCPVCRRSLTIPPSLEGQSSNHCLVALLNALCPELVTVRAEAVAEEERGISELDTSLFVCTLGFPAMPTFLHIFEPRYRLMIRRALEGNGTFGMLMYNRSGANQGSLGPVQFKEYGTMLQIISVQMMPDGRSLIETRGTTRFRVRDHGLHDGYIIGNVERIEDVSLAEEERLEAEDIRNAQAARETQLADDSPQAGHAPEPTIDSLSTREMLLIGVDFIERMRANSAPWLHQRILDAYGGPPDDPAMFPFWFASILPIAEEEKYLLLPTTSVRERLKIVVSWIRRIESQRW